MKIMTLQEIQSVSLGILKDVHRFCMENDIHYSLAYGTLIGAIRHKGFIPWDDDIDVIMPRPDYDKFCSSYKSDRYRLLANVQDGGGYMLAFARVCDCEKTSVDMLSPFSVERVGVWIDVFPADSVSDDYPEFKKQYLKSEVLYAKANRARNARVRFSLKKQTFFYNIKLLAKKILTCRGIMVYRYVREQKEVAKEVPYGTTGHWSQLCCCDDGVKSYHNMDVLSDFQMKPFEDEQFMVMKGYDGFLRNIYGDYMQLPPENERKPRFHSSVFYWK